jgi:outer membrane protein OmpA-like peptidoglycan-associated protein
MFSQDDDNQGVVLGVLFGVIALVISLVIGLSIYKTNLNKAAAASANSAATSGGAAAATAAAGATAAVAAAPAAQTAATASTDAASADGASVKVDGGVVKFYFASGKADVAAGGLEALAQVLAGVKAGKKVAISGFVDPSGNAQQNADLAKKRAFAVKALLQANGVTEEQIVMVRPNDIQAGATTAAEGRRVEVALM